MSEKIEEGIEGDLGILETTVSQYLGKIGLEDGERKPTHEDMIVFIQEVIEPALRSMNAANRSDAEKRIGEILAPAGLGYQSRIEE